MMKVQKIVSLTPHTAKLSEEIPNFSAFVRQCLLNRYNEEAFQEETMKRIRYHRACNLLAQAILDIYEELGQEHEETIDTLVGRAYHQTRLEDFE
jgi:hypothetical protein